MSNLRKRGVTGHHEGPLDRFFKVPLPSGDAAAARDGSSSEGQETTLRGAQTASGMQMIDQGEEDSDVQICVEPDGWAEMGYHHSASRVDKGADAELSIAPAVPSTSGAECPSAMGRRVATLWTCQACTYAENSVRWLRCSVCDTIKGGEFTVVLSRPEPARSQSLPQKASTAKQRGLSFRTSTKVAKRQKTSNQQGKRGGMTQIDSFLRPH